MYFTLFAIPLFTMWYTGTLSIVAFAGYIIYIDLMNNMGHCNFECVPNWLFHAFPLLKYFMYTPSFHSLHHTQFRTNYSLFMPIYDYIYGTMDKSSDSLYEKSLRRGEENPDVVHLTHPTTPDSVYHLRIAFASVAAFPYSSSNKWYHTMTRWPSMLISALLNHPVVVERNMLDQLRMQTWVVPRYSHQDEELNRSGALYVEKHPKMKIRLVDGSSLAVAIVLNSIPKGIDKVVLRGGTCKVAHAIVQALCRDGIQVVAVCKSEYEKLKSRMCLDSANNLVSSSNYSPTVWLVGNGLGEEEERKAAKGTLFIPFSQFPHPSWKTRKDCSYYSTPAMVIPKALENMDSCEIGVGGGQIKNMMRRRFFRSNNNNNKTYLLAIISLPIILCIALYFSIDNIGNLFRSNNITIPSSSSPNHDDHAIQALYLLRDQQFSLFNIWNNLSTSNSTTIPNLHNFTSALLHQIRLNKQLQQLLLSSSSSSSHPLPNADAAFLNTCSKVDAVSVGGLSNGIRNWISHLLRIVAQPCYVDEDHVKKLKSLGVSMGKLEPAWVEDIKEPKKRTVEDVKSKFSTNEDVLAIGDVFFADVEKDKDWVMQPGGPLAHTCKTLIEPSRYIMLTAQRFIQTFLADCIARVVERANSPVIYLSTDAAESETDLLQSLVVLNGKTIPLVKRPARNSAEKWDALLYRHGLEGDSQVGYASFFSAVEAMLDKTICAMSNVFIGSPGSTFTDDILRLRKDWRSASACDEYLCQSELPNFIAENE
ncbi:hypothetical protein Syun_026691 [Stephania yunnanensis]|uniref:O-fucosyltransferase family protein n=1 Tax=Stephania yunnanensis TaxID=152371 RepID=A0AAP0HWY7_9MAGN